MSSSLDLEEFVFVDVLVLPSDNDSIEVNFGAPVVINGECETARDCVQVEGDAHPDIRGIPWGARMKALVIGAETSGALLPVFVDEVRTVPGGGRLCGGVAPGKRSAGDGRDERDAYGIRRDIVESAGEGERAVEG